MQLQVGFIASLIIIENLLAAFITILVLADNNDYMTYLCIKLVIIIVSIYYKRHLTIALLIAHELCN